MSSIINSGYDLVETVKDGDLAKVKDLLEQGADVNTKGFFNATALMYASEFGHLEIVQLLLDRGARPEDRNNNGGTAIMFAARKGRLEIVRLLIDKGAKPDEKDNYGGTARNYASSNGHENIVKLLDEEKQAAAAAVKGEELRQKLKTAGPVRRPLPKNR